MQLIPAVCVNSLADYLSSYSECVGLQRAFVGNRDTCGLDYTHTARDSALRNGELRDPKHCAHFLGDVD